MPRRRSPGWLRYVLVACSLVVASSAGLCTHRFLNPVEPEPEPKVSLAVRLKYAPDRMQAFMLSIQRQRYDNWELVFVTDGPNAAARELVERTGDARIKLVETEKPMGRWGHPYRQRGIAACTGELIGLSNDDNYYVPGYFEQMVGALQAENADLVMCRMLHSYWGWRMIDAGNDLGSWLAKRELVERQPQGLAEVAAELSLED